MTKNIVLSFGVLFSTVAMGSPVDSIIVKEAQNATTQMSAFLQKNKISDISEVSKDPKKLCPVSAYMAVAPLAKDKVRELVVSQDKNGNTVVKIPLSEEIGGTVGPEINLVFPKGKQSVEAVSITAIPTGWHMRFITDAPGMIGIAGQKCGFSLNLKKPFEIIGSAK